MNLRTQIADIVGAHINRSSPAFDPAVDRLAEVFVGAGDAAKDAEINRRMRKLGINEIAAAIEAKPVRKRRASVSSTPPPLPTESGDATTEEAQS